MSEKFKPTLPDTSNNLSVTRRVRGLSEGAMKQAVNNTLEDEALLTENLEISHVSRYAANLLSATEYDQKQIDYKRLAKRNPVNMARLFNKFVNRQRDDGLSTFLNDVSLGTAGYSRVSEGQYAVGFMMSEGYLERLADERPEAIDTVLDSAQFAITDPIRKWRNEGCDHVSLPVFDIFSIDPDAEDMLNTLTKSLSRNVGDLTIDLYEAKARPKVFTETLVSPQNLAA